MTCYPKAFRPGIGPNELGDRYSTFMTIRCVERAGALASGVLLGR